MFGCPLASEVWVPRVPQCHGRLLGSQAGAKVATTSGLSGVVCPSLRRLGLVASDQDVRDSAPCAPSHDTPTAAPPTNLQPSSNHPPASNQSPASLCHRTSPPTNKATNQPKNHSTNQSSKCYSSLFSVKISTYIWNRIRLHTVYTMQALMPFSGIKLYLKV